MFAGNTTCQDRVAEIPAELEAKYRKFNNHTKQKLNLPVLELLFEVYNSAPKKNE